MKKAPAGKYTFEETERNYEYLGEAVITTRLKERT